VLLLRLTYHLIFDACVIGNNVPQRIQRFRGGNEEALAVQQLLDR
jgi:hypothetical protein